MLSTKAFALSNADDKYGARMLEGIRAKKYTYGFKNKADFSERLQTGLLGEFNLSNLLLVVAELLMRNYSLDDVLTAVAMAKPALHWRVPSSFVSRRPHRFEPRAS